MAAAATAAALGTAMKKGPPATIVLKKRPKETLLRLLQAEIETKAGRLKKGTSRGLFQANLLTLNAPQQVVTVYHKKYKNLTCKLILTSHCQILLIASHDLNWVNKVTERALILQCGQIQVDTSIQNIIQDSSTLEYYGLPIDY